MIARLDTSDAPAIEGLGAHYLRFLEALKASGFEGEIAPDYASRTVLATDNSIYQRLPQAALFPRHAEDLERIARLAAEPKHRQVVLTPRGGGTGTNGQSLTDGLVVDVSRHMNRILEIDVENRRVRVQAGVVKDQLNAALKPHGLFFAPDLSTSNRATIGGMISTDASGQGSCEYGKTRDHVLELDSVLLGGERLVSRPVDDSELETLCHHSGAIGNAYRTAREIIDTQRELIAAKFPPLNRCLTGYDLAHLRDAQGRLEMNSLLCGSEGSLGFLNEAVLNVLPIPRHSTLVNVRYAGFMDALRDAKALMGSSQDQPQALAAKPTSIETVDDKVLLLAMEDFVWDSVAEFFPSEAPQGSAEGKTGAAEGDTVTAERQAAAIRGINMIEFNDDDPERLAERVAAFCRHLEADESVPRLGFTLAQGRAQIQQVYGMRKRAVGLLGNARVDEKGEKRPIPFVEDTAVPPEHLADFIAEFRAALDARGLSYGMFGHVDAGVLHVRPAIDMKDPEQERLIREVSDEVAELTHKYGGLLWGEHGKGVRSEYAPKFFGELYPSLQRVKAAFDPHNQLNPGKIATPSIPPEAAEPSIPPEAAGTASTTSVSEDAVKWVDPGLLTIDGVPTRGQLDRQIDERAIVNAMVGLLASGGSTNHTLHLVAMAAAAGITIDWNDFNDLSAAVPSLTRIYPNGSADVNHFQAAGGMSLLIRELLDAGLIHGDIPTVFGTDLTAYTQEPFLEDGKLIWREGPTESLDSDVLRPVSNPFAATGGLVVMEGNLGRGVIKISAVKQANRVVEAPVRIFDDQNQVKAAFESGELDRDVVVVVRFQGPKANGMPELHKLTPFLGVLQDRGYKVALVTDGRMSGASGKVPAAIHVTPEAVDRGPLARLRDGDVVRVDAERGELTALVDAAEFASRGIVEPNLERYHFGMGRELFGGFRHLAAGAEQGAGVFGGFEEEVLSRELEKISQEDQ